MHAETDSTDVYIAEKDQLWGHPKGLYVCFATEIVGAVFVLRNEIPAATIFDQIPPIQ